ncbi:MAG: protease modulator HflC [Akkermansiaceae bacterium]|nr:protease modulator HflC [Akkermansiaceae bacterium]
MKTIIILFLTAIGIIVVSSMAYTVDQTEQVFITEFGKPVGKVINSDPAKNEAGLHWKLPFIQQVNRIEKRILSWDGPASEMTTRDKLYVTVDNFARWRISDPQVYFTKLRDERSALSRLDDIIGSETLSVIASHDLIEVIRSDKDRKPARDEALTAANSNLGLLPPIRYGRSVLDQQILAAAQPIVKAWGIELLDVRFKRINYKSGVIDKIYARMASERNQIADRFRSEGAGEAAKIIGRKERDLLSIQSEAYRKEQEVKGKADAEATGIYAAAYNSSPSAADFYQFVKTLDTYQKTLGKDTTTIFTSNSDLFRLFKHIEAPKAP